MGRINAAGQLELDVPTNLPPGEVRVFIEVVTPEDAADEARWAESFAKSQDLLARLAREALEEHHAGLTEDLDLDKDFQ